MKKVGNLPLEEKINLYEKTMSLKKDGQSKSEISKKLSIPRGTVWHWFNGRKPRGYKKKFNKKPNKHLSYIVGAYLGDGTRFKWKNTYKICMNTKDKAFADTFKDELNNIFGEGNVTQFKIERNKKNWSDLIRTQVSSWALYNYLGDKDNWVKHKALVEKYPNKFLQGIFDSDGGISKRKRNQNQGIIRFGMIRKGLVEYIHKLVNDLGIKTGKVTKRSDKRKNYKDIFGFRIYTNQFEKFKDEIGFNVSYRKRKLNKIIGD